MEKQELEKLLLKYKSFREVGRQLGLSFSSIQYWAKKHDLKSTFRKGEGHRCSGCGETNPEKFYGHKKGYCIKCHNAYSVRTGKEKRQLAIDTLGGKCVECGYSKYNCSLDIHHLDPSVKDEKFHRMRSWSNNKILKEIKSCVLLCKNCHSAVHAGLIDGYLISECGAVW